LIKKDAKASYYFNLILILGAEPDLIGLGYRKSLVPEGATWFGRWLGCTNLMRTAVQSAAMFEWDWKTIFIMTAPN
jgi:hypothetical protein